MGSRSQVLDLLGPSPAGLLFCDVPGGVQGKERPKATIRNGHAAVYTPERTVKSEAWIRQCWLDQCGLSLLDGPLVLHLVFRLQVPRSMAKFRQALAVSGQARPLTKPDWDNVAKLVCDALNGVAWFDDSQIVRAVTDKRYCRPGEGPGLSIALASWVPRA